MNVYTCPICNLILARTQYPMEEGGLEEKRRRHKCINPNKQDFEKELREDNTHHG